MLTKSIGHFLEQVGAEWVLWLLVGLSVISVTVMFERVFFLRRNYVDVDKLIRSTLDALRRGGEPEAQKVVASTPGMVGAVLRAALDAYHDGVEAVEEVVLGAIARERLRYDKFLSMLGTVAGNAPFVGLLGTVIGVLNAFGQLAGALEGTSRTELVMGSIAEALVATAVGLAVAIPAVVAYNAFKRRTKVIATESESAARLMLAHLKAVPATTRPQDD
jgi:biopolymer transport protein ExbB